MPAYVAQFSRVKKDARMRTHSHKLGRGCVQMLSECMIFVLLSPQTGCWKDQEWVQTPSSADVQLSLQSYDFMLDVYVTVVDVFDAE